MSGVRWYDTVIRSCVSLYKFTSIVLVFKQNSWYIFIRSCSCFTDENRPYSQLKALISEGKMVGRPQTDYTDCQVWQETDGPSKSNQNPIYTVTGINFMDYCKKYKVNFDSNTQESQSKELPFVDHLIEDDVKGQIFQSRVEKA